MFNASKAVGFSQESLLLLIFRCKVFSKRLETRSPYSYDVEDEAEEASFPQEATAEPSP